MYPRSRAMVYYIDFSHLEGEHRIDEAEPAASLPLEVSCAAHDLTNEIHNLGLLPFDVECYKLKLRRDKESVDFEISEIKDGDVIEVHGTEAPKRRATGSKKRSFRVRLANAHSSTEIESRNVIMSGDYIFVKNTELEKFGRFGGHKNMLLRPQSLLRVFLALGASYAIWWVLPPSWTAASVPMTFLTVYLTKVISETDIVGMIRVASWFVWDNRSHLGRAVATKFLQSGFVHYVRDVTLEIVYTVACIIQHMWRWFALVVLTSESHDHNLLVFTYVLCFGCVMCDPVRVQLLRLVYVLARSDNLYGAAPFLAHLITTARNYTWTKPVQCMTKYACRDWDDTPGYLLPVFKLTQLMLLVPLSLIPDITYRLT